MELNTGRSYVPMKELVTTTDGKCPDGFIEVETTLEAPMLRDLYQREHRMNSKLIGEIGLLRAVHQDDKAHIRRLEEALDLIAKGTICPDLFPDDANEILLAAKTAMVIAIAALEGSGSQSTSSAVTEPK